MGCLGWMLLVGIIGALIQVLPYIIGILIVIGIIYLIAKGNILEFFRKYKLKKFEKKYYISEEFTNLKQRIKKYVDNCNDLNDHIKNLKDIHLGIDQRDYGKANYFDTSDYNYKRPEYQKHSNDEYVYNCSRSICDNARQQPFKYVCKYFDINETEEELSKFEALLNNFEAAIDGSKLLDKEKDKILYDIRNEIPEIIKKYGYNRFQYELGFNSISFDEIEFPKYTFQYVSPGGNASTQCDVVMDIDNLNRFIQYLSEKIKFRNSVQGQRALMTSALRRKILDRDNYTCQNCGNSTYKEPNLLLEIDHKIPLSKGGMTTEDNLQVLCWRCNRSKGNKILE
ncbi:HNH endonuclease [Faecalicatena acetigenes]|uniref:HNH endonuclease n=1 Tax=Faecalicatena acetigenes TaxID=2981790 RepID=A0ABT2TDE8_9FIRM|nr:HNH endonuclease [Faecalicatena acetigenes]MCU6748011.1 HNH endonuclease [Faecalicatena acetigenes]SCI21778.1 HNH endonuclease [uncultured Clostridium sp.]